VGEPAFSSTESLTSTTRKGHPTTVAAVLQ